jgi:hypothetical protein
MQWKSTWLLLALFVVGIMSLSIVGCGSDDTGTPGEPAVTTPSTDTPVEVASIAPIDYDTEKTEIQAVYREFYRAFNAYDTSDFKNTWYGSHQSQFAVAWEAGGEIEQVHPVNGWTQIKAVVENLWNAQGTKGQKWVGSSSFSEFWIRRKASDPKSLEASAKSFSSYRDQGAGVTYAYLVKNDNKDWLIQQIDSNTGNVINRRGNKPNINKYFTDPSAKVK